MILMWVVILGLRYASNLMDLLGLPKLWSVYQYIHSQSTIQNLPTLQPAPMCKQIAKSNVARRNFCIKEFVRKQDLYLQILPNIQKSAEYCSKDCKYHSSATHLPTVFTTSFISASYPAMCRFKVFNSELKLGAASLLSTKPVKNLLVTHGTRSSKTSHQCLGNLNLPSLRLCFLHFRDCHR